MTWVRARLVKRATDDGLMSVEAHVPLGTEYEIDLGSEREATFFNTDHRVTHTKVIVDARGGVSGISGYMARDLVEVVADA